LEITWNTQGDAGLQARVAEVDARLREKFGVTDAERAIGVVDLMRGQVAMIHPDRIEYAASIAKIGILIAYFHLHPEAAENLDPVARHELGLMIKASSNEMATKFSEAMGLLQIQEVLNAEGFYDATRGGGIWMGKHYGKGGERIGDPVGNNSHGATIRQLLRFYVLLDQEKLISHEASRQMKAIFESPEIPHDDIKFVKGLAGRNLRILRKWGSWENYYHDSALITGANRRYILVALVHHSKGDAFLEELASSVDSIMELKR
jgi:beta-lactamase class A